MFDKVEAPSPSRARSWTCTKFAAAVSAASLAAGGGARKSLAVAGPVALATGGEALKDCSAGGSEAGGLGVMGIMGFMGVALGLGAAVVSATADKAPGATAVGA